MEQNGVVVNKEQMKVVDGNVVISSEELAAAIQDESLFVNGEEEAMDFNICLIIRRN